MTRWVTALKGGDVAAAQPLWERYHRQLVTLARRKLRSARRRAADEARAAAVVSTALPRGLRACAGGAVTAGQGHSGVACVESPWRNCRRGGICIARRAMG